MTHKRIVDENEDDEEVTAVTHEINQLIAAGDACRKAVERVVRASDSLVKSLTPPGPLPAVHVHRRDCWLVYSPCVSTEPEHEHDWTCGTGELSSRCPEIREEETTKT